MHHIEPVRGGGPGRGGAQNAFARVSRNRYGGTGSRYRFASCPKRAALFILTPVVEGPYTTAGSGSSIVAFLRRRGNAYYLVHNLRRGGKVKQLHLACLGDRPRLTDDVIRKVRRSHPMLEVNWSALRKRLESRGDLLVADSDYLGRLAGHVRKLNLELADLAPRWMAIGAGPETTAELISLLKLLRSTVEIKLREWNQIPVVPGSRKAFR